MYIIENTYLFFSKKNELIKIRSIFVRYYFSYLITHET